MANLARIEAEIELLRDLSLEELRAEWRKQMRASAPTCFTSDVLFRALAFQLQVKAFGGLDRATERLLDRLAETDDPTAVLAALRQRRLKPGTELIREWAGTIHRVVVVEDGFSLAGKRYTSLSEIARLITGTNWNGPRFFGLRQEKHPDPTKVAEPLAKKPRRGRPPPGFHNRDHQAGGFS